MTCEVHVRYTVRKHTMCMRYAREKGYNTYAKAVGNTEQLHKKTYRAYRIYINCTASIGDRVYKEIFNTQIH